MRLIEPLEEMRAVFPWYPYASVSDTEPDSSFRCVFKVDVDSPPLWAKFNGVVEQVHDDLLDAEGIDQGVRALWCSHDYLVAARLRLKLVCHVLDQLYDVGRLSIELERSGLETHGLEQVCDQTGQAGDLSVDQVE
jgi:hypothetical protein